MASDRCVAEVVGNIFTAAGRPYGKPELDTFQGALTEVGDADLAEAGRRLVAAETWPPGSRPSPGMLLAYVRTVLARAARPPVDEGGPVTPRSELAARIASVRPSRLGRADEAAEESA